MVDYERFSRSFTPVRAEDVPNAIEAACRGGHFWLAALSSDTFRQDGRAHLRAELDAYHAHLYGLTRDQLRYVLDPADGHGEDYPSETFRGLKSNEFRGFGEYRTAPLVLETWGGLAGVRGTA